VVSGKLTATPHGTYIRLWHRFTTHGILFITLWLGTVLGGVALFCLVFPLSPQYPRLDFDLILPLSALLMPFVFHLPIFLAAVQLGARWGRSQDKDLLRLVSRALGHGQEQG
jgi:hypothetical protein